MSPLTESTRLVLSKIQQYPAVIGEPWGGGYFAGYISHTANGNPTHALIVAPRATGATGTGYTLTTNLAWKTTATTTANTNSSFDGVANTAAMVAAGIANHPAAQFCVNLNIGGFTDWYLPALFELDIANFNLKPTGQPNATNSGANIYAVPIRTANNTENYPSQTFVTAFQLGNSQAFVPTNTWSSSQSSSSTGRMVDTTANAWYDPDKTNAFTVRAFRRITLP